MGRKKAHTPEEIAAKLRQAEVLIGQGKTVAEAQVLIEDWRRHTKRVRPHSALGYRPPAPETMPVARSQVSSGAGAAALAH
jgi:putative transposase